MGPTISHTVKILSCVFTFTSNTFIKLQHLFSIPTRQSPSLATFITCYEVYQGATEGD
jgi:hypothetical protein